MLCIILLKQNTQYDVVYDKFEDGVSKIFNPKSCIAIYVAIMAIIYIY